MTKADLNGTLWCPVLEEWQEHQQKVDHLSEQVGDMKVLLLEQQEANVHLKQISECLNEVKEGLLKAVLGKDFVPLEIAKTMISEQSKVYKSMIKIQYTVFGIIIIVLIGIKYVAPNWFAQG